MQCCTRRQSGCNAHSDFHGFYTNCCHLCSWWQGTDTGGVDRGSLGDVVAEYIGMFRCQGEDLKVSEWRTMSCLVKWQDMLGGRWGRVAERRCNGWTAVCLMGGIGRETFWWVMLDMVVSPFFFQNKTRWLDEQSLTTKKKKKKQWKSIICGFIFILHFTFTKSDKPYLVLHLKLD